MERLGLFERKQHGTIVVPFPLDVVFASVLRPAALIESELIAKTAPAMGAVFLCAVVSPDSSQSGKNHPGVTYHCIAIAGHICGRRVLHQLGFFRAQCIQCR